MEGPLIYTHTHTHNERERESAFNSRNIHITCITEQLNWERQKMTGRPRKLNLILSNQIINKPKQDSVRKEKPLEKNLGSICYYKESSRIIHSCDRLGKKLRTQTQRPQSGQTNRPTQAEPATQWDQAVSILSLWGAQTERFKSKSNYVKQLQIWMETIKTIQIFISWVWDYVLAEILYS